MRKEVAQEWRIKMLIHKMQLQMDTLDVRKIKLPFISVAEAREHILKIETQYGIPCAWYQTDVHNMSTDIQNEFYLMAIGTGHDWGDRIGKENYLGTALLYDDTLVLHYFLTEI